MEEMNWFMSAWTWLTTGDLGAWVAVITFVIAVANAATVAFPSTANNPFLNLVLRVLNFLAVNVLKNKNADDS